MARPKENFKVKLEVKYIPLPKDRVGAWRAAIVLLLDLLRAERDKLKQELSDAECKENTKEPPSRARDGG